MLLLLWPGGLRLLIPSAKEISYSAGFSYTTCSGFLANDSIDSDSCRAEYRISVGNTGREVHDVITLQLSPVPPTWRLGSSVTDIVASAREKIAPEVRHQQTTETLTITITDLHPNRLVQVQLLTIGEEAAELLRTTSVSVDADATIIETNPQLTVVTRFVRSVLGIFGW